MALSDPTPNTQNKASADALSSFPTYTLASGLGSGSSSATAVRAIDEPARLVVEAATSNAFDIQVQYHPNDSVGWATVASFTDSDTNDINVAETALLDAENGDYRVLHNSGESVTVTLRG